MREEDRSHDLGFTPQPMVRWLGPRGLATTALQVLLSTIFGAYSDKREIQAALKESCETDESHHDELWFDFLADTGDGFNPTYTTARLLAEPSLDVEHDGATLHTERGRLLVLGGDLAYPAATPAQFRHRFLGPYELALPEGDGDPATTPKMFACAGNHDWYDGLTTFLRLFCEGKSIGGWQTEQTRSYFTIRLPHGWWIMVIDLAFDFFIDEPQMAFFRRMATEELQAGDRVILVTHRPSWLFPSIGESRLYTVESLTNLQQFERDILHANDIDVPLVLAGDIHHYNRYVSADGAQQRITAGSGGTFLHPTDYLHDEIDWPDAKGTTTATRQAVYPDVATSKRLRWGTLLAPFKNPSFVVFVGAAYLLFALMVRFAVTGATTIGLAEALQETEPNDVAQALFDNPVSFLTAAALALVFVIFTDATTTPRRVAVGLTHWLAHFLLLVVVIWGVAQVVVNLPFAEVNFELFFVNLELSLDAAAFIVGVAVLGGLLGAELFALYLFLMYTLFQKHATHAFSSQRLEGYRAFLRLKLERDGALTIYPLGVRSVPRRWRRVRDTSGRLVVEPVDRPIECHLIEAPVRIEARRGQDARQGDAGSDPSNDDQPGDGVTSRRSRTAGPATT